MSKEQSNSIDHKTIAAHNRLLKTLSNLSLPGQIQEFPDRYEPRKMIQFFLHPIAHRAKLEQVRRQVGHIRSVDLGASQPVQGAFEWLLEQERSEADKLYVVSWHGDIVPTGLEVEGHFISWTQNGRILAVPPGKSLYGGEGVDLGTYERWIDPRDTQGSKLNVMALYINSRNLPTEAPELPNLRQKTI